VRHCLIDMSNFFNIQKVTIEWKFNGKTSRVGKSNQTVNDYKYVIKTEIPIQCTSLLIKVFLGKLFTVMDWHVAGKRC